MTGTILAAIGASIYGAGTAPKNSPLCHVVHSAYEYVVKETLGIPVKYEETLGKTYNRLNAQETDLPILSEERFDSLIEKCEPAIRQMHRPIINSKTAEEGVISIDTGSGMKSIDKLLDHYFWEYLTTTLIDDDISWYEGRILSYNSNTFYARIYIPDLKRPIPFELSESARNNEIFQILVESLCANAAQMHNSQGIVRIRGYAYRSKLGRIKKLRIFGINE